ncbi:adenylate/guanylate cyclase domain-containing protein [Thermodesulfobacteriota bacterium]
MSQDKDFSGLPQRKFTTIFAADVVGYSRMMGVDENGTYELLGKCRKIIDRNIEHHGGRIFNTAGDSVMAEFASTVEAVRCAIEIQEEAPSQETQEQETRYKKTTLQPLKITPKVPRYPQK